MTGAAYRPADRAVLIDAGPGADIVPLAQVPDYVAKLLTKLDRLQTNWSDWRDHSIELKLGDDIFDIPAIEAMPLAIAILNAARVPRLAAALTEGRPA